MGAGFFRNFPLLKIIDFRGEVPHKSAKNRLKNGFSTGLLSTLEHSFARKTENFALFPKIFPILFFSTGCVFPKIHILA